MTLSDGRIAIEGAFHEHLRLLKRTLRGDYAALTVMGPLMSQEHYTSHSTHLATFSPAAEGISFLPLEPKGVGPRHFYLKHFAAGCKTIWFAAKAARIVHAGPSHAFRLSEFIGIVAAVILKRPSIFVVDVDWREDARMNYATGRWNYRNYLMDKCFYQPFFGFQVHFASRYCSLVLLKGQGLVDSYGRNRPHVKNLLDAAHSQDHIIPPEALSLKLERLINPSKPLNLVYFGRLTAYKGIDRCLLILRALEDQLPGRFRFKIIGAGEDTDLLKTMTTRLGLSEIVTFLGPRAFGTELFAELRDCDIAMATPLAPDAPRSALDAMCSGLPILAFIPVDSEFEYSYCDHLHLYSFKYELYEDMGDKPPKKLSYPTSPNSHHQLKQ
jgi:glycosyltransferase involved in cell wall biosynthesis